jgi:hypothetical protein
VTKLNLTRNDKRTLIREGAAKILKKAIAAGYKLWQPGEIVAMSDRAYLVQQSGAWKRLFPLQELQINGTLFQVGTDGRTLRKV